MLNLKGEVQINGSINVRTEKHGTENHTFMDIKCSTLVKRDQLKKLLREDLAITSLFNEPSAGHFEPLFGGKIGAIPLLGKFPKTPIEFICGVDSKSIAFEDSTIKSMSIDPQIGGMTAFKFTCSTEIDEIGKALFDFAGTSQQFSMKLGKLAIAKEDQMELPMGDGDGDSETATSADEAIAADDAEQESFANPSEKTQATLAKQKRVRPSRSKAAKAEREAANGAA